VPSADTLLISRYYEAFNARRFGDAAALVSPDCEFHHLPTRERVRGPRGYLALVEEWVAMAPNVTLTPEQIIPLGNGAYRIYLRVQGRFSGAFEVRPLLPLDGDGGEFNFVGVHDLTFRDGAVTVSRFTYDLSHLIGRDRAPHPKSGSPDPRGDRSSD
jgi:hypothetical protein